MATDAIADVESAVEALDAMLAFLEPGDYLLYRNTTWHMGIYMPYRRRATIFDFVEHPDYARWRAQTDKQWHVGRDKKEMAATSFDELRKMAAD